MDRYLRAMVDAVPAILCGNRADGTCDFANARAYEYTGMPAGSLEGFKWLDLIHPEDRPRVQASWLEGLRAGFPFNEEYRMRRADGVCRWFHSHVVPIADSPGAPVRWFGVSTEIHERKTAREHLEQLVETHSAHLRQNYSQWLGKVREQELTQQELHSQLEFDRVIAHLLTRFAICSGSEIDKVDLRIVGNAIAAILQRKRAEEYLRLSDERFSLVFQGMPEPLMIESVVDQRIVDVNPRFLEIGGFSREEVIGKTSEELGLFANPEDRDSLWSKLRARGGLKNYDLDVKTNSGALLSGLLSAVKVKLHDGEYFINLYHDLTERRRADAVLRRQGAFDRLMTGLLSEFVHCPSSEAGATVDRALTGIAEFFGADQSYY